MRKILLSLLMTALLLTACGSSNQSAMTESGSSGTSSTQPVQDEHSISGFDDLQWGVSEDDVKSSDSSLAEVDTGISGLTALTGQGSIQDIPATVTYCFGSDGLETIGYEITTSMTDDQYQSLCDTFTQEYGQAAISKESNGWGQCSVWVDSDKDYAYVSETDEVIISKAGSGYTNNAKEFLQEFHEIDLDSILGE